MGQKGTEKDRIVGKNRIEGRRTDGNRQRRTENVREQILRNSELDPSSSCLVLCFDKVDANMMNLAHELSKRGAADTCIGHLWHQSLQRIMRYI